MRVVTLLPSATEIVYALGLEPVGVSQRCPTPPTAATPVTITRSSVDTTAGSAQVDAEVQEALDEHGDVFRIDADALVAADPDLIITQGVCDVCAVDQVRVRAAVADCGLDTEVLTTDVHSLADLMADIVHIGTATGTESRATALVAAYRERIARIERIASTRDRTPRVLVLDWMEPVMVAGHWMPELVERAGGSHGITVAGSDSRPVDWQRIRSYDPEVLIVAPCGFSLERSLSHLDELSARDGWTTLSAVRDGRAVVMAGDAYVNRPGPRLIETLESLAGVVQPSLFDRPPTDVVRSIPS